MDDCFVERNLQMILSIAVFKDGFGSLNDIAKSFALTVKVSRSTTPLDL